MAPAEQLVERVMELLSLGHEARGFEVKGPGLAKGRFFAKVVRAALSMGNLRDGGLIVIGVDGKDLRSLGPGLNDEQAASWDSFDALSADLAEYADPPLQFHSELVSLPGGARVFVLDVAEFSSIPHFCKKTFDSEEKGEPPVLRRGAVYVRTRRLPETVEMASSEQMRELVELATEKALAAYVTTAQRAGLTVTPADRTAGTATPPELFDAEREAGWR